MNPKKSKDEMLQSLTSHLPQPGLNLATSQAPVGPSNDEIIQDAEEDYNFARSRIKKLIDTSDEAIATMHDLARDAEHPRAFEVLTAMIKNAADMNSQLLALQKERKRIVQTPDEQKNASSTTNNTLFVGSTVELQKFLKGQQGAINV